MKNEFKLYKGNNWDFEKQGLEHAVKKLSRAGIEISTTTFKDYETGYTEKVGLDIAIAVCSDKCVKSKLRKIRNRGINLIEDYRVKMGYSPHELIDKVAEDIAVVDKKNTNAKKIKKVLKKVLEDKPVNIDIFIPVYLAYGAGKITKKSYQKVLKHIGYRKADFKETIVQAKEEIGNEKMSDLLERLPFDEEEVNLILNDEPTPEDLKAMEKAEGEKVESFEELLKDVGKETSKKPTIATAHKFKMPEPGR